MGRYMVAAAFLAACLGWNTRAGADMILPTSHGQTIYLPSYSNILHGNFDKTGKPDRLMLSTMLSIRNTDSENAITIISAKYYDTNGNPIREYVTSPVEIKPLATLQYMVEHKDDAGGSGAKFLIEWKSKEEASIPLAETVNAYFFGTQSMAFTTTGRPVARKK